MELINQTEQIIKDNGKYQLVVITSKYSKGTGTRIEIRNKDTDYKRGFAGVSLEEVKEIFEETYNK